jgi:mannose-6-phosphate isomerase
VLSPAILNLVQLEPGEAIYLQPGELHAYLHGVGIELMANSDNVVRGGLTPKHIDASELIRIINFDMDPVQVIESVSRGTCERVYPVPAEEFLLSVISVTKVDSFTSQRDRSVEILICINGEAGIKELGKGKPLALTRGESVVVPAVVSQYQIEGSATLYRASVPLPPNPHEPSSENKYGSSGK